MKKFKKTLSTLLVITVVASILIAGTLAYLTKDAGKATNVFSVGDIDVTLDEEVAVIGQGGEVKEVEDGAKYEGIMPGDYLQKEVTVTNNGSAPAYVAVTVDVNNFSQIRDAIESYGEDDENAEAMLDYVFDGWGLTVKDRFVGVKKDMSYKVNEFVDSSILHVDSAKRIVASEVAHFSMNNWFKSEAEAKATGYTVAGTGNSFYLEDADDYSLRFTYYIHLNGGASATLFKGLNVPAEFNADQMKMFDELKINVSAKAIQADNMGIAEAYKNEDESTAKAKTAFAILHGLVSEDEVNVDNTPIDTRAEYNGTIYETLKAAIAAANANGGGNIEVLGTSMVNETLEISSGITISTNKNGVELSRAEGFTGTLFNVKGGGTLTIENLALNGEGATATGNLIATEGNGSIVLNEGTVLKNNHGAHAVSLATRGGGTLTLNGAQIINNSSDSGAIWGGGHIIVNEGSKISNNSSTGSAGAIRMVSSCNLTMNGGEISNNTAAGDGGAIWGYGSSTYNFNGGTIKENTATGTGGAIYTGTYSTINISGDFELCNNNAANSGAIRLTDHTSMNMTGGKVYENVQNGESNAFNTWNNSISITGGEVSDDFSFVGGLGLTIGAADIEGTVYYDLSTNHNTAYLSSEFNSFKFKVNEEDDHFMNFNFKPADGYSYSEGDEDKLICMNEGYSMYWDTNTSTFKIQKNQ